MVEPAFLAVLAIAFLVVLALILRSGGNNAQPVKEKPKRQPVKEKKYKGPKRNALKKDKRPDEVKEWTGVDTAAKDAQEMLEFLKGKDPVEIARLHGGQAKQTKKKGANTKKAKDEAASQPSGHSAVEVTPEGFSVITNKKPKPAADKPQNKADPQKEKEKEKEKGPKRPKAFFKEEEEAKKEKGPRKPKRERTQEGETEEGEKKERKERPPRDNKEPRPPRSPRENRGEENKGDQKPREKKERKERAEGEEPRRRAYPTAPPNVKYEQADLDEILNAITLDYNKPKPQTHRINTIFSKIPRSIVTSILFKLEALDIVALSEVNYYFSALAHKETLWKELLLRDFGIRDLGRYRGYRAAYRAEYKKKHQQKKRKEKEPATVPEDEQKDSEKAKGKKDNKSKATTETPATEEKESKD